MAEKSQTKKEEKFASAAYEKAGATFLSQQSDDIKPKPVMEHAEWKILRSHLEGRLVALRNWRNSWWMQNWSELAQYILPRRSIWLTQSMGGLPTPNNMTRGLPLNNSIKDPTGTFATRVCAAGLMSGLASVSRPWFKVTPAIKDMEIDDEGREWLDEIESRMYRILAGSNFYNAFAQECEDLVVYGSAPNIIYEDESDLIRCYNPAVGEYYMASGSTMRIDGLYRSFVMTIAQIVEFFGLENCPPEVIKLWRAGGGQLEVERIIAHSIEPNFEVKGAGKLPGNFTWREVYWVYGAGTQQPLSVRGFVEQPFTAARWATQSNDAYGRSPGMDVLPDIIQLQVETVRKAEGIEKGLRPPLLADMALKNSPSSILPGHVTYVPNLAAGSGMRSIYDVQFDLNHVTADIQQIQQRIKIGLFNDLFLMLEQYPNQKMTAYEVAQKITEKMQVLGPVIENLLSESLKPKLKRVYSIAARKGMLPEPPDSMKDVPLSVEFISMLALAQKATATGGLERIAALVGNLSGIYPEVKNILDPEIFVREFNDLLANPQKILRDETQYKSMLEQQQQEQQMMQQQQAMAAGVGTAKVGADAASVLSKTEIGGGQNALAAMLGGQ